MGVLLFIIVLVASIYVMSSFLRARSGGIGLSRREPFLLNHPRAGVSVEPKVTPVDEEEAKKIPDRLPPVNIDYVPTIAPLPEVSLAQELLPSFTTNSAKIEESLLFRSRGGDSFYVDSYSRCCQWCRLELVSSPVCQALAKYGGVYC
jgi:hypothetical protein